jgi:hypothetical protein
MKLEVIARVNYCIQYDETKHNKEEILRKAKKLILSIPHGSLFDVMNETVDVYFNNVIDVSEVVK